MTNSIAYDPWRKIDRSAGPDACWPWTQSTDRDGYGVFKTGGRQYRTARWVLQQKLGRDMAEDEKTRHTCDNPICCNPSHLIPGTGAQNAQDMVDRGRSTTGDKHWTRRHPDAVLRGETNGSHVLTAADVRTIREMYATGSTQTSLAQQFGVSQPLISQITRRTIWTHL